jgi:hypothetical protein
MNTPWKSKEEFLRDCESQRKFHEAMRRETLNPVPKKNLWHNWIWPIIKGCWWIPIAVWLIAERVKDHPYVPDYDNVSETGVPSE